MLPEALTSPVIVATMVPWTVPWTWLPNCPSGPSVTVSDDTEEFTLAEISGGIACAWLRQQPRGLHLPPLSRSIRSKSFSWH